MHKKIIRIGKEIAEQFAISFFFCAFIIIAIYFVCHEEASTYLSIVNMMTVEEKSVEREEVQFDSIKKRLKNYPRYGERWATIKIPEIGVEAPVFHGDSLDIIKYGVGHYTGSYFPGEGGAILLAGHNSRENFMYLPKLNIGSEIIIEASYGTYTYKITETKIIHYKDTDSLPIQSEKEVLMMYTCYPVNVVGFKTKRYVVYAELVGEQHES